MGGCTWPASTLPRSRTTSRITFRASGWDTNTSGPQALTRQRRESSSGCPQGSPSPTRTGTLGSRTTSSMRMESRNTVWSCGTGTERVSDGTTPLAPSRPSSSVKCEVVENEDPLIKRLRQRETLCDHNLVLNMSSQLSCLASIDNFILIYFNNQFCSIISLNNSFNQNYFLLFY